jgi:hypothetical protein
MEIIDRLNDRILTVAQALRKHASNPEMALVGYDTMTKEIRRATDVVWDIVHGKLVDSGKVIDELGELDEQYFKDKKKEVVGDKEEDDDGWPF